MTTRISAAFAAFVSAIAVSACRDASPTDLEAPPPTMVAASELAQQAVVNHFVASDPTVRVTDRAGRPVIGATVVFSASVGASTIVLTSPDGTASVPWKLSARMGPETLMATLCNASLRPLGPTVNFSALAVADTLAAIQPSSVADQLGFASAPAPVGPSVVAVDQFGNGKPGIEVTFAIVGGGGSVTPLSAITDSDGRATVTSWTLGPDVGENTLSATVANLPPVMFTARVNPPFVASSVVSGGRHSCAIGQNGNAYCWGANDRGQVNGGVYPSWHTPQAVALTLRLVSLSAGFSHTCAISDESPAQAYCWGDTSSGRLGAAPTRPWGPVRVPVAGGLTMVTSGSGHSCGLGQDGTAYCWGDDTWGQLGDGTLTSRAPVAVAGSLRFVSLAAGASHTCGLTTSGQLACWGLDDHGQLGFDAGYNCLEYDYYYYYYGGTPVRCALQPQIVAGAPTFIAIAAGDGTCGLTAGGDVICYGIWSGTGPAQAATVSGVRFARLFPGARCGETAEGLASCWSPTFDTPQAGVQNPLPQAGGLPLLTMAPGASHMCGILTKNSSLVCWGNNDVGQLGNGTMPSSNTPLPVAPPVNP